MEEGEDKEEEVPEENKVNERVEKENSSVETVKSFTDKARENPWIVSTIVFGILGLILIVGNFTGVTGNAISSKAAEDLVSDFVSENSGEDAEIVDVDDLGNLYGVNIMYKGSEIPLYVTKDGGYLAQGILPLGESSDDSSNEPDVAKSDNPVVELFIMTHCPYGTQAEKGFIPVVEELGDKLDMQIRFVHYFMHEPEEEETPRQICIREEQSDKYLDYLECFLEGDGNVDSSGYIANGNDPDVCISEAGIDKSMLDECIANNADSYYESDSELSEGYGVSGSPTLVVNGEIASSGRSPSAYLETVCSAFNEPPEECSSLELDSASPSAGFGWETTGSGSGGQC